MTSTNTPADLYLRMSDLRGEDDLDGREARLRTEAARLGWTVARVVIENDKTRDGRRKGVSAFKRVPVLDKATGKPLRDPATGRVVKRVYRPGWQSVLSDLANGRASAVLAEDLARVARDVRDGEDLIDACTERAAHARSLSGNMTLTDGGSGAERMTFRMMLAHFAQESADKAWRVAQSRERLAKSGNSGKGQYGGGRRPFGYVPDAHTVKYGRTLVVVETEAAHIRRWAIAVLAGVSLRALAREMRDLDVPTVTGAAWAPDTIRGILLAPVIAGLAQHTAEVKINGDAPRTVTTLHAASWPAILARDETTTVDGVTCPSWQSIADILTDPARRTSPGNEPRWLVSNIARCHCGARCTVRGSERPSYVCASPDPALGPHVRRTAPALDAYVGALVCERLSRPDARELLRPAPRPGCDARALRTEAAQLRERKAAQLRMHAAGDLDDNDLIIGLREIKRRLAAIDATLAANSAPDPLAEFRSADDVVSVWAALPLARQREVVRLLMSITLERGRPGAPRRFDPQSVTVEWAV